MEVAAFVRVILKQKVLSLSLWHFFTRIPKLPHIELASGAIKDGWFTTRPVLFTIDYKVGEPWGKARAMYCEG